MAEQKEITIRLMGRFSVIANGQAVERELVKSRKGLALLELLILARGEVIPSVRLQDTLWDSEKNIKPENALKTLISRFRVVLASISEGLDQCITTERNGYRFNTELGVHVDLYEIDQLKEKLMAKETLEEEDLPDCERLLSLYSGDLLPEAAGELWVQTPQVKLHNDCFSVMYRYVDKLNEMKNYEDSVYVCRRLLEIDNFDERLQLALMDTMLKRGNVNEALTQHKHATELYYKYLGMEPPESIKEFYRNIVTADRSMEESLRMICEELHQSADGVGAFVCEYSIFKEIYALEVRANGRTDFEVYIMLVMLQQPDGSAIEPMKLSTMMDRLQEILRTSLRRGDVISRFSPSKIALLLPMDHKNSGSIVMERVKRTFYREFTTSDCVVNYKISNAEGLED